MELFLTEDLSQIRAKTEAALGLHPCLWQLKVVEAILKCDQDVICIVGTGMGKTLTSWMPLLFQPQDSLQIIITPLNILGKQNVTSLIKASWRAIFIRADTATAENFHVSCFPHVSTITT